MATSTLSSTPAAAPSSDGILLFMSGIRLRMLHDPRRQAFEDQIQIHGFNFLDDYLEDVLVRPKYDE